MKHLKNSLACILCTAALLSVTACGNGGGQSEEPEKTSSEIVLTNKTLKWMSNWAMNPEEGGEDRPELKMFKEKYGGQVEDTVVVWDERVDAITSAAMSDDCPDMTGFWYELMPAGFHNGLYRQVDDIIDVNAAGWKNLRPVLDLYTYDGHHYVPTPVVSDYGILIYNKETIKKYNLEDPRELFRQGKWTWDKMLDMMKQFTNPSDTQGGKFGRYGIDGGSYAYNMHMTSGTPFVSLTSDCKLQSNLRSKDVEAYMNFISDMKEAGVMFPQWENGNAIVEDSVTTGKTLFFDTGLWAYSNYTIKKYAMYDNASFVPYPKNPSSDKYYRGISIDPHMVFGGAKNIEGIKAWQECRILVNQDPVEKKKTEAVRMSQDPAVGEGYSQDDMDFYYEMADLSQFSPVVDWSNGLGVDGVNGSALVHGVWVEDKPWATVREEYAPLFDAAISQANGD